MITKDVLTGGLIITDDNLFVRYYYDGVSSCEVLHITHYLDDTKIYHTKILINQRFKECTNKWQAYKIDVKCNQHRVKKLFDEMCERIT